MRNGGASKMYNSRKMGEKPLHLISSWKFSSVLVAVFISISIPNCVGGEESTTLAVVPPVKAPVILQEDSPSAAVVNSSNANAQSRSGSSENVHCEKPKIIDGKRKVSCSSYSKIPNDIPNPDDVNILDMSKGNSLQTLKKGQLFNSKLTSLKELNLQNCQILGIERGTFAGGNNLIQLDLSNNKIEVLDPEAFDGLAHLKVLNLQNNQINRFEKNAIFPPMPMLATLDLSDCKIDSMPGNVLDRLVNLKTLNLNNNKLKRLDWQMFRNTRHLHAVNLGGNLWECDCHTKFVKEALQEISAIFHQATCRNGEKWTDVHTEKMTCSPKIDKFVYEVLNKAAKAPTEDQEIEEDVDDKTKVRLDDDVYFECEYTGYPKPTVIWRKGGENIEASDRLETRKVSDESSNSSIIGRTDATPLQPKIEFQDVTFEITRSMVHDEKKNNFRFREHLIVRRVKAEDAGQYTCRIESSIGGVLIGDVQTKDLTVSVPDDVYFGGLLPGGKKGLAVWMWILIVVLCVLILVLISLLTCLIWKRREKRKQEGFRKVVHEKFKDSNIDLGEFDIKTTSPHSQQSNNTNRIDGATPLLDNRSESSTIPISDHHLRQNAPHLPDVALGNASLVRNSAIFSPKPPPSLHGYPTDARKEFFARQISEPYLRPASAMSLSRPAAMNAAQRRYIFANQPYQSEPVTGEQDNLYAVPSHIRDFPRSGSAMSVSALPEYDLRRQMFLRQYSQPQSQYATASRLPPRRLPSTSSEPPHENMATAFNYSTLPRRPIRLQNWSRPVSPTNSTCSNYSTLSWRPNVDPRTGVISDGMGARNTAHGGSTTSINKIPDMNGTIIGGGDGGGLESMNRAMLTPSSAGKVKGTGRNPRYGHNRTPSSLTRGHNDFFSFEPIQEVESSETASTNHLDRAGGRQTPTGYSTQSLARGEPRYKKKKPPPIAMIPNNLKTPSGAFEHLKGRSISPALRNNITNSEQPTEEIQSNNTVATDGSDNDNSTVRVVTMIPKKNVVNNTDNQDVIGGSIPVPMLESPIDEYLPTLNKSSSKAPPPPPPPKPKRQHQSQEELSYQDNGVEDDVPTKEKEIPPTTTADGTVV